MKRMIRQVTQDDSSSGETKHGNKALDGVFNLVQQNTICLTEIFILLRIIGDMLNVSVYFQVNSSKSLMIYIAPYLYLNHFHVHFKEKNPSVMS